MIHSLLIIIILVVTKDLVDLLQPVLGGITTSTSLSCQSFVVSDLRYFLIVLIFNLLTFYFDFHN